MVLKAAMVVGLVFNVVEADHLVFELLILVVIFALVAAACQERPQDEQRNSDQHKHRVLQQVNNQENVDFVADRAVDVENESLNIIGLGWISWDECGLISRLIHLNQVDGVAEDNCFDDPLDKGGHFEAAITAEVFEAAVTHRVVDTVETAQAAGDTLDLAREAQVDEEVVVHQVED